MNEIWVCADCRSVNGAKQSHCYRCHVPRKTGEMTQATASLSAAADQQTRTVLAQATRMGARYIPTWPLAVLLIPLMIAATWSLYLSTNAFLGVIDRSGHVLRDPAVLQPTIDGTLTTGLIFAAALLVWSIWVALVVRNVPALTARWAPNSSLSALFAAWIPFINLKRPHSVIRGVLATLDPARQAPILVALGWWVSVLAAYLIPTIYVWFGPSGDAYRTLATTISIQNVLVAVSLVFAIAVVVIVEAQQHRALRRRADAVLGDARATA